MDHKVIVIALDGATFELLGPWIEQGRLPHLKANRVGWAEPAKPSVAVLGTACPTYCYLGSRGSAYYLCTK